MQKQDLLRQKPRAIAQHRARGDSKTRRATNKETISTILKKSEYWPLTLLGHCVHYFGVSAVAGALVGAAAVYGYAFFRPLPFIPRSRVFINGLKPRWHTLPRRWRWYLRTSGSPVHRFRKTLPEKPRTRHPACNLRSANVQTHFPSQLQIPSIDPKRASGT